LDVNEYNRLTKMAELVEHMEIAALIDRRRNSTIKYSLSEVIEKLGLTKDEIDNE
jgi:hypothetical protein